MALSPFDRLEPGRRVAMGKSGWGTAMPIMAQKHNWRTEKNSLQWARGSVRRASGLVQIPISLIYEVIGPVKRKICTRHR
jgi:hypothetical protein